MSLQLAVGNAVATLTAVSQACKGAVQLWILHGLFLTANAAGLAYVPYCKVCGTNLVEACLECMIGSKWKECCERA